MDIKNIFAKIKLELPEKKDKKVFKIQNDKNKYIFILKMLSILIITLLAGLMLATFLFVYQTVMNTIDQVQSISLYQSELRIELIDFNRLDKIEKKWEEKISNEKEKLTKNPFIKETPIATTTQKQYP